MSLLNFFSRAGVKAALNSLFAEFRSEFALDAITGSPVATATNPVVDVNAKLTAALSRDKYKFRTGTRLAKISGLTGNDLYTALIGLGARQASNRGRAIDSWGLVSRVGRARPGVIGAFTVANGAADPNAAKLVELLSDPAYQYRSFDTLQEKLGVDDDTLTDLLETVGARAAVRRGTETDKYGLIARVGAGPLAVATGGSDEDEFDDED